MIEDAHLQLVLREVAARINSIELSISRIQRETPQVRQAVVTAYTPGSNTVEIDLAGVTLNVAFMSSYSPTVGDTVYVQIIGTDPTVTGALQT